MKKLSLILIVFSNLSIAASRDCCDDFLDAKAYISNLEAQSAELNKIIDDMKKSEDAALTELEKQAPGNHVPWYFYTGLGLIAGGLGARFLLK